jgi:predicted peptidase
MGMVQIACALGGANADINFDEISDPWSEPTADLPEFDIENPQSGQQAFGFSSSSGRQVRYQLYIPDDFNLDQSWPLIVFLHGSNGVGTDIENIASITPPAIQNQRKGLPFIVISPQNPVGIWPEFIDPVDELVQHLVAKLPIDEEHITLTGLSDGGYGTWVYALRYPQRFDAIVPISYGPVLRPHDSMPDLCRLEETNIWIFHSENDAVIPIEPNYAAVEALEDCGNETIRFTVYPSAGHGGAWLNAYRTPSLYSWMQNARQ